MARLVSEATALSLGSGAAGVMTGGSTVWAVHDEYDPNNTNRLDIPSVYAGGAMFTLGASVAAAQSFRSGGSEPLYVYGTTMAASSLLASMFSLADSLEFDVNVNL